MSNASFKQKILNSIAELPVNASIDDIILKIFLVHKSQSGVADSEKEGFIDLEDLIKDPGVN